MSFDLNIDQAIEEARRETGLNDFGDTDFIEPLRNFSMLADQAPFTEAGASVQRDAVHRHLVNRLRANDDFERFPSIHEEDVSDPLVVLGFPRSGTTVLQRMLSADPHMQNLALWRVLNPAPLPGEQRGDAHLRMAVARQAENAMRAYNPSLFTAHPMIADEAEEDWFLHHLTFQHIGNIWAGLTTKGYLSYLRTLPRLPTYRYVADLLRYLQWQDGGRRNRRWVLKSPIHIGCIEEMLQVHPEAVFIYAKRDFTTVMASFCHALESSVNGLIDIKPESIGELAMDFWVDEMARFFDARQRLGPRLKLIELNYQDLLADPITHIRKLYCLAGIVLSEAGETAIRNWITENPAGKHGKNNYSLDRYGLTADRINSAFTKFK